MASSQSGGINFSGALAIAFIVLKLTNTIHWAWLWVLSPIWIPFAIVIVIMIVAVLIAFLVELFK